MISLDSSHGPTMENPPEKDRDAATLLSAPELRSPPMRPGGKAPPSSEICERWPPDAEPCCGARVKFSWDGGFIFMLTLLAVEGW
jgi:hypothetical protein